MSDPLSILAALAASEQSERDWWTERAALLLPTLCQSAPPATIGAALRAIAADPTSLVDVATGLARDCGVMLSADHASALARGPIVERDRPESDQYLAPAPDMPAAPEHAPAAQNAAYVSDTPSNLAGSVRRSTSELRREDLPYLAHATSWHRDADGHARGWEVARSADALYARHGLPALLGGDYLAFPEVIHAGRTDDPYGVASHHGRVADALAAVDPDYREVVADACTATADPHSSRGSIADAWPMRTRLKRYAPRKGEHESTDVLSSWATVARVTTLPTYLTTADGVRVIVGHGHWQPRHVTVREQRAARARVRRTYVVPDLMVAALRAAVDLKTRGEVATITLRDARGVTVTVSRAKSGRFTCAVRLSPDGVRDVARNVREPAQVAAAVARRVAA